MALVIEATRVLLQSDDALWYWLELATDEGRVRPYCDGVAVSPPGGATAYAIVTSNTADTYRLSLATEGTDVNALFAVSPGVETPDTVNLDLSGTVYALTAWVEEGKATWTLGVVAGTPPTITVEPSNASYSVGDTFHLSVTATGDPTLTYQWRKGGVNISGEVDDELYFIVAEAGDAGSYDVVVSNAYGSDTSVTVTVTIAAVVPTSGSASANGGGSMAEMEAALRRIQAPVPMQGFDAGGPIPMTEAPMPNTFIPLTGTPTAPSPVPHFFPW